MLPHSDLSPQLFPHPARFQLHFTHTMPCPSSTASSPQSISPPLFPHPAPVSAPLIPHPAPSQQQNEHGRGAPRGPFYQRDRRPAGKLRLLVGTQARFTRCASSVYVNKRQMRFLLTSTSVGMEPCTRVRFHLMRQAWSVAPGCRSNGVVLWLALLPSANQRALRHQFDAQLTRTVGLLVVQTTR